MTSTLRSLFARTYMRAALVLTPLILIGAECDPSGPAATPLAMDAMRAEIAGDGSFFCDNVSGQGTSSTVTIVAQGDNSVGDRRIELVIPKQATVPYTVNVASDAKGLIYYCVPLTSTSCKNFYADVEHGGTGTITVTHIDDYIEGTFRGTVTLANGNETRSISGGEFKVNY